MPAYLPACLPACLSRYNLRFVPTVNGVSQALVPQPSDYPKWQRICGFLMMEDGREDIWSAPEELMLFVSYLAPAPAS